MKNIVLATVVACFAFPWESPEANDDSFAEYLQREGEYYRAVTEYLRLIHAAPNNSRVPLWKTNLMASLVVGGKPAEALDWAGRWATSGSVYGAGEAHSVLYPLGVALELQEYDFATILYNRNIRLEDSSQASRLERGYAIAMMARARYDVVDSLAMRNRDWSPAFRRALNEARYPPQKNPVIGRWLSLIPGAGYFYVGMPGTGAASLAIFSVLGYATYESIRNDHIALAIGVSLFNIAWYTGSISVSAKHVETWNTREREALLVRLNQHF